MKCLHSSKTSGYPRQLLLKLLLVVVLLAGLIHWHYSVTADSAIGEESANGPIKMIGSLITEVSPWEPVATSQIPNLPGFKKFYDVASCKGHLFAGSNIGLFLLDNSPKVWSQAFPVDKIVSGLAFTDSTCNELFAAVDGAGVWRGTLQNNEWNWSKAGDISPDYDGAWDVLVTDNKLFVAGDFGIRWSNIPNTGQAFDWKATNINKLTVSLSDSDSGPLAAVWLDGVYTLLPGSDVWTKVSGNPPPTQNLIHEVAANSKGIIAGTQTGLLFAPAGGGWSPVTIIPQQPTFAAVANQEEIYVGRLGPNVYVTTDGITWRALPRFLNLREDPGQGFQVRGFDIGLTDGQLYAATTSGVWRLVDEIP
jgi:hypothetical protein